MALAGPLREAWRRLWGPTQRGDELADAPLRNSSNSTATVSIFSEVRQDIVIRQVGHASREISQRYNHPPRQAHLAAAGQVASLVRIPDFRLERPPCQARPGA